MFHTVGDATVKNDKGLRQANRRRTVRLSIDVPLLLIASTLGIFGLLMV